MLFCLLFSMVCIHAAYKLHFPDLRVYMCIGYGGGFIIYLKILHRIVAFFEKVCYNILTRWVRKRQKSRKNSQKEVNIKI